MADFERRERFDNAIIDLSDMTINLTIERCVPLPQDGRDVA